MTSRRHWSVGARAWLDAPFRARPLWLWLVFPFLLPLSLAWAWEARRRRARGFRPFGAGEWPRVCCVGNLVLGGAGKSPVVRAVAAGALERGQVVAVVTRGVGRSRPLPVCVGSHLGEALDSALRHEAEAVPSSQLGDEAREHFELLKLSFPEQPFVVLEARNRRMAIEALRAAGLRAGLPLARLVVVLDDGYQHFDAPRHVDFCVMNPDLACVAPRFCPPLGPWREGTPRTLPVLMRQPKVRVWSRTSPGSEGAFLATVRRACASAGFSPGSWDLIARSALQFHAVAPLTGALEPLLHPGAAVQGALAVVTGIAHGERFLSDVLKAVCAAHAALIELPDHGRLNPEAMNLIASADVLVLTGKDYFRWKDDEDFHRAVAGRRVLVALLAVELLECEKLSQVDIGALLG